MFVMTSLMRLQFISHFVFNRKPTWLFVQGLIATPESFVCWSLESQLSWKSQLTWRIVRINNIEKGYSSMIKSRYQLTSLESCANERKSDFLRKFKRWHLLKNIIKVPLPLLFSPSHPLPSSSSLDHPPQLWFEKSKPTQMSRVWYKLHEPTFGPFPFCNPIKIAEGNKTNPRRVFKLDSILFPLYPRILTELFTTTSSTASISLTRIEEESEEKVFTSTSVESCAPPVVFWVWLGLPPLLHSRSAVIILLSHSFPCLPATSTFSTLLDRFQPSEPNHLFVLLIADPFVLPFTSQFVESYQFKSPLL